ncbi:hypothetical protein [Halopenitus persicus]|uniref:Uncharacterized protein n=1 Tax=Halopenitus persicus TaxID=1048396 RepID=A0A1H3MC39_9EURY|nr:hypothetical protein [Halopenitus persicus]SDY74267.1 hypothetical protein SAMN05216564_10939 [Halopenitus persicus]
MQVSVVICTYTMDRYEVFTEAVENALSTSIHTSASEQIAFATTIAGE